MIIFMMNILDNRTGTTQSKSERRKQICELPMSFVTKKFPFPPTRARFTDRPGMTGGLGEEGVKFIHFGRIGTHRAASVKNFGRQEKAETEFVRVTTFPATPPL